jgi:NADP-dependent 3-hydroxy acid dehydrogenase YdfG
MSGRGAIVTGASSGIGRAAAVALARRGHSVMGASRAQQSAWGPLPTPLPGALAWSTVDLAVPGAMADLLSATEARFPGKTSIVVLSAGKGLPGTLLTSSPEAWRALMEINYLALMEQMRATAQHMLANREAFPVQDLVVIGSTVGRQISAANPVYGSTKFAIHSLVESLRQEVCRDGIRVTLIEPGFVRSGFQAAAGYDAAWFDAIEAESGPFLTPENVADVIAFIVEQPPHVHVDDVRLRPTRQRV